MEKLAPSANMPVIFLWHNGAEQYNKDDFRGGRLSFSRCDDCVTVSDCDSRTVWRAPMFDLYDPYLEDKYQHLTDRERSIARDHDHLRQNPFTSLCGMFELSKRVNALPEEDIVEAITEMKKFEHFDNSKLGRLHGRGVFTVFLPVTNAVRCFEFIIELQLQRQLLTNKYRSVYSRKKLRLDIQEIGEATHDPKTS